MSITLDIALDRTPDAPALIIDGLRLPLQNISAFEHLEEIFDMLIGLKMETEANRRWQGAVMSHLRRVPHPPDHEV